MCRTGAKKSYQIRGVNRVVRKVVPRAETDDLSSQESRSIHHSCNPKVDLKCSTPFGYKEWQRQNIVRRVQSSASTEPQAKKPDLAAVQNQLKQCLSKKQQKAK